MDTLLKELCAVFGVDPAPCTISLLGSGQIHDTYLLERCGEHQPPLILQRINQYVFQDVRVLMRNMELVTEHLSFKNRQRGKDSAKSGIVLLETDEGDSWIGNEKLGYWRMCWYIENSLRYEFAENEKLAFEGGRVIAEFQQMLADVEIEKVGESIPGYSDLRERIHQFEESLESASSERLGNVVELRAMAAEYSGKMLSLYSYSEQQDVPVRITHNNAKFNNILFTKNGEANCMIDLDTVMPGYVWYDYGEALRGCASEGIGMEVNEEGISFRMDMFEAFTKGYVAGGMEFLTDLEVGVLHRAPALFAYMQAIRFLTDYLKEDVGIEAGDEKGYLLRAQAQFVLMQRILDKEEEMRLIVEKVWVNRNS